MNPKVKKTLIISGFALDALITILLFVFSILILANAPSKADIELGLVDETSLIGWFSIKPIRILLLDVLPLLVLLAVNVSFAIWYVKKTGNKEQQKKSVSLNDLSEEEKAALKQKILQEMMQNSNESK